MRHTHFDLDFGWYTPPLVNMLRIILPLLPLLETDAYLTLQKITESAPVRIGERGIEKKKDMGSVCLCVCVREREKRESEKNQTKRGQRKTQRMFC